MEGEAMSSFFGYQVVGLFQEDEFHTEVIDGVYLVLNAGILTGRCCTGILQI